MTFKNLKLELCSNLKIILQRIWVTVEEHNSSAFVEIYKTTRQLIHNLSFIEESKRSIVKVRDRKIIFTEALTYLKISSKISK